MDICVLKFKNQLLIVENGCGMQVWSELHGRKQRPCGIVYSSKNRKGW